MGALPWDEFFCARERERAMDPTTNPFASPAPETPEDGAGNMPLLETRIDEAAALVAEGALAERDYREAQKLHGRERRYVSYAALALLAIFAATGAGEIAADGLGPDGYIMLGAAFCFALALFVLPPLSSRRTWKNARALREPMKRLITPSVMQTITPTSNVMLRWSVFLKYRANADLVLLYLTEHPRMFLVVPRRMFRDDDQWRRFVALVEQTLPRG
jgi:hypothetical protein